MIKTEETRMTTRRIRRAKSPLTKIKDFRIWTRTPNKIKRRLKSK